MKLQRSPLLLAVFVSVFIKVATGKQNILVYYSVIL